MRWNESQSRILHVVRVAMWPGFYVHALPANSGIDFRLR